MVVFTQYNIGTFIIIRIRFRGFKRYNLNKIIIDIIVYNTIHIYQGGNG